MVKERLPGEGAETGSKRRGENFANKKKEREKKNNQGRLGKRGKTKSRGHRVQPRGGVRKECEKPSSLTSKRETGQICQGWVERHLPQQ